MRTQKAVCTDIEQLRHRLLVNDNELPYLLGCGAVTARRIAENAGAVVYQNTRKLYSVRKLELYLDQQ